MDNEIINGGFVLLSRKILNSEIWRKPPEYLKIFLYILLKVNHNNGLFSKGSNFFNFSDEKPHGVTKDQVYKFLQWAKSEKVGILATQKTTRGVIIKVNNYDTYQDMKNYYRQDERQNNGRITAEQRQNNGNTINKELKELKENNIIYIEDEQKNKKFTPPTIEEIKKYCLERKNSVDPQRFYDYYNAGNWKDSKGKPIKNWKQKMIAVWEKKAESNKPAGNKKFSNSETFYMSLSK